MEDAGREAERVPVEGCSIEPTESARRQCEIEGRFEARPKSRRPWLASGSTIDAQPGAQVPGIRVVRDTRAIAGRLRSLRSLRRAFAPSRHSTMLRPLTQTV